MDENLRILMLEDNRDDVELICHELKKSGTKFSSKCVETKEAFVRELKEDVPHVVLADYSLPSFNGLEAFRDLRSLNHIIPFILVTGSLSETLVVQCLKEGMDDYIQKDRLARLPPAIKSALEKKNIEREKEKAVALLRQQLDEVERINRLMVARELKMGDLKVENKKLKLRISELEKQLAKES